MSKKEFVIVVFITFLVVIIWIGTDIYYRVKKYPEPSSDLQQALEVINPTLDDDTLTKIRSLNKVEGLLPNTVSTPSPSPSPLLSPSPSNQATPSASP